METLVVPSVEELVNEYMRFISGDKTELSVNGAELQSWCYARKYCPILLIGEPLPGIMLSFRSSKYWFHRECLTSLVIEYLS